jgi:CRISPR-associated protein Cmr4
MQTKLLLVHALSPLHAGTGQGVGIIDLPIAREKATGIPFLPGSSIKGVLRDRCTDLSLRDKVFGPETKNSSMHAGSAQFADARLLLLPVRSLAGTFAWVTSPLLLERFRRDADATRDLRPPTTPTIPSSETSCVVAKEGSVLLLTKQPHVVLEDLLLEPIQDASVSVWAGWLASHLFPTDSYWQTALTARLCIVSDNVLSFLLQTATEVTARIQLEPDKKTVKTGALWYEEALPSETVLSSLVIASSIKESNAEATEVLKNVEGLTEGVLQFGGNATIGRGLCRLCLL